MKRRVPWLLVGLLPLASACSFLLDFNELQHGGDNDGGAPEAGLGEQESGTAGGPSDAAADDASDPCPGGCDDGDPCTDDACDAGHCVSTPAARLIEDGLNESVVGDKLYRAALVAGAGRFYLAAYGVFSGTQDIAFYDIPADGDSWTPGPSASQLTDLGAGVPISPPALLWNDASKTLSAYFAVGIASPLISGRMERAELSADLEAGPVTAMSETPNYHYLNNTLGPASAQIPGGSPFVAWAGTSPSGTGIYVQSGTTALAADALPQILEPAALRGLATLYGLGAGGALSAPGVVWMTQRASTDQVDTHLQLLGNALPQTFAQCNNTGVQGVSLTTSPTHLDGFWFAGWTKQRDQEFDSELTAIECTGARTCSFNPTCGEAQERLPALRNPKLITYHRAGDGSSVAHQVLSASIVDTKAGTTSIVLRVQRLTLQHADAGAPVDVGSLDLAEGPVVGGPDWPEVALIGPDKIAAAWIEYGASSDTLKVGRYRICYGE